LGGVFLSKIVLFAWNQTFWPPKFLGWLRHCVQGYYYICDH